MQFENMDINRNYKHASMREILAMLNTSFFSRKELYQHRAQVQFNISQVGILFQQRCYSFFAHVLYISLRTNFEIPQHFFLFPCWFSLVDLILVSHCNFLISLWIFGFFILFPLLKLCHTKIKQSSIVLFVRNMYFQISLFVIKVSLALSAGLWDCAFLVMISNITI